MSGVSVYPAGGHAMVDVCRMHPSFASGPLPCTQLCHWDVQPCPRAALPKSALAWSFCPRGSPCPGLVRAHGVISDLSRMHRPGEVAALMVMKVWCNFVHLFEDHQDVQDFASSAGCWVLRAASACPNTQPQ